jgi:acylphosphatase
MSNENESLYNEEDLARYERSAREQGIKTAAKFIRDRSAELFAAGKDDEKARMVRGLAAEVEALTAK